MSFLGDALGGKPSDDDLYGEDGKPDYRKMRSLESFQAGIDKVLDLAVRHTVVSDVLGGRPVEVPPAFADRARDASARRRADAHPGRRVGPALGKSFE